MNEKEDQIIRDMMQNSASHIDTSNFDGPTIISLYDTVEVLSKKNPDWIKDKFCQMIFAWNSDFFLDSHVEEVCKDKCPDLLGLCMEYRECKTVMGLTLPTMFGISAIQYVFPTQIEETEFHRIECAPVRDAYFEI